MRSLALGLHALVVLFASLPADAQPEPGDEAEEGAAEPAKGDEKADRTGASEPAAPETDEDEGAPRHPPVDAGEAPRSEHPPVDAGEGLPPGHPPVQDRKDAEGDDQQPPVPLAPPDLFPSQLSEDEEVELVGFQRGVLFLRDAHDDFRLYPGAHVSTDFHWSPGAPDLPPQEGGRFLEPSFMVRRVNVEVRGEIIERIGFTAGVELGGARVGRTRYAGPGTPRFAPVNVHDGAVRPSQANISYRFRDWLGLTAGLQNVPFSTSNRTRHFKVPFTERNVAIRGFAVPHAQDLGLTVWGDAFDERMLGYEIGVFGGDGPQRPFADGRADYAGRAWIRPFTSLGEGPFFDNAQIGVSGRFGERDPALVAYDYPTIASNHGFVFWQPGYVDSFERVTHVIPSGAQRALGGELRVPFSAPSGAVFDIQAEGYYVKNDTREAVEGFVETNTERFGRVEGGGFYVKATYWACCTDPLVTGEPGHFRPWSVDPGRDVPDKRGLDISVLAAGIIANYDGATRQGSAPDPNTPSSNIALWQFGGIAQYWFNHNFRGAIEYMAYFAPDSGDPTRNQAVVPDNLLVVDGMRGGGHVHHELGGRLAVTF